MATANPANPKKKIPTAASGSNGSTTTPGPPGPVGPTGKSAYEIAVEHGYKGSEQDWLDSLVGRTGPAGVPGKSAYQIALDNGFEGSEEEWLESLVGGDPLADLNIDDSLKMEGETLGVKVPVKRLLQSEYNSLSDEKKASGLYFVYPSPPVAGDIVDWAGYTWRVFNVDNNGLITLGFEDNRAKQTIWSNWSEGMLFPDYPDSVLATVVKEFENLLPLNALADAVETTVNGITEKVYAPYNFNQWPYARDAKNRVFKINNVAAKWWEGVRNGSHAYAVDVDGTVIFANFDEQLYFRPFVTLRKLSSANSPTIYLNGEKVDIPTSSDSSGSDTFAYKFGHGLKVEEKDGEKVITVETVSDFNGDKSLPMTASGVELIVGNVEALLKIV